MPVNKRYRIKCATKGGTPRHVIVYAPSAPKARAKVLDIGAHLGVGNNRITSVLETEVIAESPAPPKREPAPERPHVGAASSSWRGVNVRHPALSVECPECGAEPGSDCQRSDGRATLPHRKRTEAAT